MRYAVAVALLRNLPRHVAGTCVFLIASLFAGCVAPAAPSPIVAPPAGSVARANDNVSVQPPPNPLAFTGKIQDEPDSVFASAPPPDAKALGAAPRAVPAPPTSCRAIVLRSGGNAPPCATGGDFRVALDAALSLGDTDLRDGALLALEACSSAPSGLVRALRIDLAPIACGDVLAESSLTDRRNPVSGVVRHVLVGQAIAARQARLRGGPPALEAPFTQRRLDAHLTGPVRAWYRARSAAVQELTAAARTLVGYGRAIAMLESGRAELRIDADGRMPAGDVGRDDDLRNAYVNELAVVLAPNRERGLDASLEGLAAYATLGAIDDPRMWRGRKTLLKAHEPRLESLAWLILPPLGPVDATRVDTRLAARLPSFYTAMLLPAELASDPTVLRAMIERGFPTPARGALRAAPMSQEIARLVAHARLRLGTIYWRAVDFDQAVAATENDQTDDAQLLRALALSLRGGASSAMDTVLRNQQAAPGFGHIAPLLALAHRDAPVFTLAAYDAVLVEEAALPTDPPSWKELVSIQARYSAAAEKVEASAYRALVKPRRLKMAGGGIAGIEAIRSPNAGAAEDE